MTPPPDDTGRPAVTTRRPGRPNHPSRSSETHMASPTATTMLDDLISARLRDPDYPQWRALVEASGGCTKPIRLTGSTTILNHDGAVLLERAGDVFAPCGNRRATICPACSDRYAADAFHLLRAGLAGDSSKGVPTTVVEHPRVFLTLTAPSFGPVHTRKITPRGLVVPCRCGRQHRDAEDRAIGTALDLDRYDYEGAVLWQAHATRLWHRFVTTLTRALAGVLGVPGRAFREHARLSYAKVAEYQLRGLVHFHAAIRADGPDGPADPPPAGITQEALADAIRHAARAAAITTRRPDGTPLVLGWGIQLDLRPITATVAGQLEDGAGQISDAALAGYIAKYATKTTGATEGPDRPIRDGSHIAFLDVTEHHRRMIETAWELGGRPEYERLGLRRWAHMLGFRGHFLTKSRRYSVTFTTLRGLRRTWRLVADLAQLGRDTDGMNDVPPDPDSVLVINDWRLDGIGHRNEAERELAHAIAERHRNHRQQHRQAPTIGGPS